MTTSNRKNAKTTTAVDDPAAGTAAAEGEAATTAATGGAKAKPTKTTPKTLNPRQKAAVADGEAKTERKARADTKQARLVAMLGSKEGATVEEIAAAFSWQAHTVRGALYGALKRKLGLDVQSEKVEGRGRVYRIGS